jgi:Protein of unknown function (DUF3995)
VATGCGGERTGATATGWAYLASAWFLLFAAVHIYWAAGGNAGLASSAGYDLAARRPLSFVLLGLWGTALLLVAGAVLCAAMARWQPHGWRRRAVTAAGWLAGALLLARGLLLEIILPTGAGGIASSVGPAEAHWSLVLWNPWFIAGGVLVLLATYQFQRL